MTESIKLNELNTRKQDLEVRQVKTTATNLSGFPFYYVKLFENCKSKIKSRENKYRYLNMRDSRVSSVNTELF
jgi:hypothetical protein